MFNMEKGWNTKHKTLKSVIEKQGHITQARSLFFELHAAVHFSEMSGSKAPTYADELWNGLSNEQIIQMPQQESTSIAWYFWHSSRVEDVAINRLLALQPQVINEEWLERLGIFAVDIGLGMSESEIFGFNQQINLQELRNYRNAVGRQTRAIVSVLETKEMKRKVTPESVQRIMVEGAIIHGSAALEMVESWGKRDVAGLLLMPATRYQVMQMNACKELRKHL